jgi:hypothetical protein
MRWSGPEKLKTQWKDEKHKVDLAPSRIPVAKFDGPEAAVEAFAAVACVDVVAAVVVAVAVAVIVAVVAVSADAGVVGGGAAVAAADLIR